MKNVSDVGVKNILGGRTTLSKLLQIAECVHTQVYVRGMDVSVNEQCVHLGVDLL